MTGKETRGMGMDTKNHNGEKRQRRERGERRMEGNKGEEANRKPRPSAGRGEKEATTNLSRERVEEANRDVDGSGGSLHPCRPRKRKVDFAILNLRIFQPLGGV